MLYIVFNTSVVLDIPYSLNLHINQPFKEDTDNPGIQGYRDIYIYSLNLQINQSFKEDTDIQGYRDTGTYTYTVLIYT